MYPMTRDIEAVSSVGHGTTLQFKLSFLMDPAIAGGYLHSLAVQNGGVYAWGYNGRGQLGSGNTADSSTPMPINSLSSGVTAIAGGGLHSLALQNGAVFAWGSNAYAQLGDDSITNSSTPLAISSLSSGVTAIAAGDSHSLAVQNGAVYAWGGNSEGELGSGTTVWEQRNPWATPARVADGTVEQALISRLCNSSVAAAQDR